MIKRTLFRWFPNHFFIVFPLLNIIIPFVILIIIFTFDGWAFIKIEGLLIQTWFLIFILSLHDFCLKLRDFTYNIIINFILTLRINFIIGLFEPIFISIAYNLHHFNVYKRLVKFNSFLHHFNIKVRSLVTFNNAKMLWNCIILGKLTEELFLICKI